MGLSDTRMIVSAADPMERAISLAQQALGSTSPNPAVGAVIVKDGVTLGSRTYPASGRSLTPKSWP